MQQEALLSRGAYRRGRRGEAFAARYLESTGWEILDRNWRDGPRELDLVCRKGGIIAFVEVKTRRSGSAGHPLEAIGWRKRRDLERAARAWVRDRLPAVGGGSDGFRPGIRFDAMVVVLRPAGDAAVEHIPDAWRPGWGPG